MSKCLSHDQLMQLLHDAGGGAEREALEEHLGDCAQCQARIQDLAVADTVWAEWDERLKTNRLDWPGNTLHERDVVPALPVEADPANWPVVPGYEILGVLGKGGMGIVFKARQLALDRLVALKTLPLNDSNRAPLRKRLRREAETLAQLHHPHVVQIFEILEHDGAVILALEMVHGGSLADRLKDSTLGPDEAARLVELLARTMHDAHQANILHRDLKPANVMLTSDGVPKITDFGLARRLEVSGDTHSGHVIGTPSYLAPEQAQGREGWSAPPVDIYGLGTVLYESLTGRPPFRANTSFETLRQVVQEEPASPSSLQPRLPRDLVTICQKCLRKEPTRRYASCLELAEDLQRFQTGRPILARRTSPVVRFAKWTRRHPLVTALSVVIVITLSVLVALWGQHTRDLERFNDELRAETQRANEGQRDAETARGDAELQRRKAMVMVTQLSNALTTQAGVTRNAPGAPGRLTLLLPLDAYARVLSQFNDPELQLTKAQGYHWLGGASRVAGDAQKSAQYLSRAILIRRAHELTKKRDPDTCFEVAVYLSDYGFALLQLNDYDGAEKALRDARAIIDHPKTKSDPVHLPPEYVRAELDVRFAALKTERGELEAARAHLAAAKSSLQRLPAEKLAADRVRQLMAFIERQLKKPAAPTP